MEPFAFNDPEHEVFKLDEESLKEIEDAYGKATLDYLDGYREGFRTGSEQGYEDGLSTGWLRGREDILHQLKRYAQDSYDPDLEQLLKEITGD